MFFRLAETEYFDLFSKQNNTSIHSRLDVLSALDHETVEALNHITMMYSVAFFPV